MPVREFVADGEAIALTTTGRPLPFQVTASRVGSRDAAAGQARTPLTLFLFDALHVDGIDLLDEPTAERHRILSDVVPVANRPDRIVTSNPDEASQFLSTTLDRGHEGVMVKSLSAPYEAGRRGSGWLKVKPVHTLDLVVLAVEWGSGRRRGWLSNIHLGARDPATGGFVMLGKTFKGMTDEMLAWQTERFLQLANGPTTAGWCRYSPGRSWRSLSTECSAPPDIPAGWPFVSPGFFVTETTSRPRRRTPSMPFGRSPRSDD